MDDVATFLIFTGKHHGNAQEAVAFHTSTFPDAAVQRMGCTAPCSRAARR